jgi:Leucine-rich repeat (LRR) protein
LPENLPSSLKFLYCNDNELETLPRLPKYLHKLHCENNQLKTLPADLPSGLAILNCSNNPDLHFPDLKSTALELICVQGCPHFSLDMLPDDFSHEEVGGWYAKKDYFFA